MPQTKAHRLPSAPSGSDLCRNIGEALANSSYLLDSENFSEWLSLTTENFAYGITAYSPELKDEVVFLEKDRNGLAVLFDQLSMHERYPDKFRRIISVSHITNVAPQSCDVFTPVSVFHTNPSGVTGLYCVGVYADRFEFRSVSFPMLAMRKVTLDTRRLPFGSHIPI